MNIEQGLLNVEVFVQFDIQNFSLNIQYSTLSNAAKTKRRTFVKTLLYEGKHYG